jgi:uncharacterized surface protein with fasciclin (FAS1) repeats
MSFLRTMMLPCLSLALVTAGGMSPAEAHDRGRAHAVRPVPATASTVVGVAAGNPDFSTLVAAVQNARLVETLSGTGPFTVFAPDNAAFSALPEGTLDRLIEPARRRQLQAILGYHVVPGAISASDLTTAIRVGGGQAVLKTVQGGTLIAETAGRGRIRLRDSTGETFWVTGADIQASNGVIHAIDGVMTPGH